MFFGFFAVFSMKTMQLYLCLCVCLWAGSAFGRSMVRPETQFQVQNTQSTITLPVGTTGQSMLRARPDIKNHEDLLRQCKYFPTSKLRQLCVKIAENPIIVAMEDNVRGRLKAEHPWTKEVAKSESPLTDQSLKCPDYSDKMAVGDHPNERSLSPWNIVPHHDHSRYPQWIAMARCMCEGCIDQKTGKENLQYASREVIVRVRVMRMNATYSSFRQCTDTTCFASDEEISVGCHCSIPINVPPTSRKR